MTRAIFEILLNLLLLVGSLFSLYGIYFCIIAVFGLKKTTSAPSAAPHTRFAIAIAARNEEKVLGDLLDSLHAQNYPADRVDIYVAPNNCTDDTRGVALRHGANIFELEGEITAKGQVLEQITSHFLELGKYDAVCVFDADNVVDPDFLQRMNDAYQRGVQVAQGRREGKNPLDSGIATCYAVYYWVVNRFYNGGREALGLSSLVVGSGFMVSTSLLQRLGGWRTTTITEDYEFSAQCVLQGERVHYIAEAVAYDELPLTFGQSWKQRRRWVSGFIQSMKLYLRRLFKDGARKKSPVMLDVGMAYVAPVVQTVSLVVGVVSFALSAYGVWQFKLMPMTQALLLVLAALGLLVLACALFVGVVVYIMRGRGRHLPGVARGALMFVVFLISWLPITIISLFKQTQKWEAIHHSCSVAYQDIAGK